MVSDELSDRTAAEWCEEAANIIRERGIEYGDPRNNLLRIYKLSKIFGVQLRNPSDIALVFLATKLSRIVESPGREDSYIDLIGYGSILAQLRFTSLEDWSDLDFNEEQ